MSDKDIVERLDQLKAALAEMGTTLKAIEVLLLEKGLVTRQEVVSTEGRVRSMLESLQEPSLKQVQ